MKLLIVACFIALACASPLDLAKKSQIHAGPGEFKCDGRADGFYADLERGCKPWHECQGGAIKQSGTCKDGHIFNENLWACDLAQLYTCPIPAKRSLHLYEKRSESHGAPAWLNFKCEGRVNGYYADKNRGCHTYYKCTDGAKVTNFCPGGTIFNEDAGECQSETTYTCPTQDKRDEPTPEHMAYNCQKKKDGFYPKRRCDGFYRCVDKKTYLYPCAEGTRFDRSLNICNHKNLVNTRTCTSTPQETAPGAEEKLEKLRELLRELKDIK